MRPLALAGLFTLSLMTACGADDGGEPGGSGASTGISGSSGSGGASGGAAGGTGGTAGSSAGSAGSGASGAGAAGAAGGGPTSSQRVVGYLPTWRGVAEYAPRLASAGLTHVNLAFANPEQGNTPTLGIPDEELATFVQAAHAAGARVLISIGGGDGSGDVAALLTPGNVQAFVDELLQYVEAHDLDGLDVDIEGESAMTEEYAAFVMAAGAAFEPSDKLLTAALATWFVDAIPDDALAQFDFINVMSYDHCGPWTDACEQSTYEAAVADLQYFTGERAIAQDRVVLGVPFYAWCWGAACTGEALTYAGLLEQYPDAWQQDWIEQDELALSYNGRATILSKLALGKLHGGMMAWELGQDASGEQSLLATIVDNL